MTHKKKVGIFGGSFDPIHWGHLNMAVSLMEACALDQVLFVTAGVSPFKEKTPPAVSGKHRLHMVELAICGIKSFAALDWEIESEGPSYTIDTVRRLSKDPSLQLHLLIGEDHLDTFHRWNEADELTRLSPPLVACRAGSRQGTPSALDSYKIPIPLFDISITVVRQRLIQKKYCDYLIPASVLDYIEKHRLYSAL